MSSTPPAATVSAHANLTWRPLLAVGTALVLWASAFVVVRHLAGTFGPGALALGRLLVGSLVLGLLVLASHAWRRPTVRQLAALVAIGVLWFGVYNVALNAGEQRVDAGTAALLIQISPVLIAVLALRVLGESVSASLVIGIGLAFAGVALIAGSTSGSSDHDVLGVLLCLLSALVYAVSVVLQKPLMRALSPLQVTWTACTTGAVVCLPFAGALVGDLRAADAEDIGWLVYLGVFPTALAFTAYAVALRSLSASSLGATTYLVPPMAVLLSWAFLAEVPSTISYVGGALTLVGVAVTRRRPSTGS